MPIIIITTSMAIIGAFAVARNKALFANALWSISNPILMIHNYNIGEPEQAIMFLIFTLIAWYGIYYLRIKPYI